MLSIAKIKTIYDVSKLGHKSLVLWAADCAEHILPYFENKFPGDNRPREAIEVARAWVKNDGVSITEAAYATHAAARKALSIELSIESIDQSATYAARAAGHAAATAHTGLHATGAAAYAVKATSDPEAEVDWQQKRLKYYENQG